MLMSSWVLLAVALGQVIGQDVDPCEKPVVDYVNVTGETYGLVTLRGAGSQTAGGYILIVRLHTPIIPGRPVLKRARLRPRGNGPAFLVGLPSQDPRSTIKKVAFNGNVVCESEAPFEGTTSEYTLRVSSGVRTPSPPGVEEGPPPTPDDRGLSFSNPNPVATRTPRPLIPTKATSANEEACGVVTNPSELIFGGQTTDRGDWPWLAALVIKEDMNFFCGSTLISRKHVVTAAHCMFDSDTKQQIKKETFVVALGKYDISNWFESEVQYKGVRKMFIHDDYDQLTLQNDITILLLESPVKYNVYVRPICLWTMESDFELIMNRNATVIGWGRTETSSSQPSNIPLRALVPIVHSKMCAESHVGIGENIDQELVVCAGAKNGVGPCQGDSGGALMMQIQVRGLARWFLRGVVSFSPKGKLALCHLDNYSIYTDVAKYIDWINDEMKNT